MGRSHISTGVYLYLDRWYRKLVDRKLPPDGDAFRQGAYFCMNKSSEALLSGDMILGEVINIRSIIHICINQYSSD